MSVLKLKLKAGRPAELQARAAKKAAWLQARGVDRVLIVYEKHTACLYPERRPVPR